MTHESNRGLDCMTCKNKAQWKRLLKLSLTRFPTGSAVPNKLNICIRTLTIL